MRAPQASRSASFDPWTKVYIEKGGNDGLISRIFIKAQALMIRRDICVLAYTFRLFRSCAPSHATFRTDLIRKIREVNSQQRGLSTENLPQSRRPDTENMAIMIGARSCLTGSAGRFGRKQMNHEGAALKVKAKPLCEQARHAERP